MESKAIYAGSFDPPTLGHFHMVEEGLKLFDHIVIAIGENPSKKGYFATWQRLEMINQWITESGLDDRVIVTIYENLLTVDLAEDLSAKFLLRGIRNAKDYEYEMEIKDFNDKYNPNIQTVFLTPKKEFAGVSSSVVRGLVGLLNWERAVKDYVSGHVIEHLKNKYRDRN